MLMRDFARFRACYCGICKEISRRYGQIPRLSVSYDLTFFTLLFLALAKDDAQIVKEACILNPLRKKFMLKDHPALSFGADMAVLLSWQKARDDARDEQKIKGSLMSFALARAGKKAQAAHPDLSSRIEEQLKELALAESVSKGLEAADIFGAVISSIFSSAVEEILLDLPEDIKAALRLAGESLGRWIYLADAIDDYEKDLHNKEWNLFSKLSLDEARNEADSLLKDEEACLDRIFALISYERDSSIIYNVIVLGLAKVRQTIIRGEQLEKL